MSKNTVIPELHTTINTLESALHTLRQHIQACRLLVGRVYTLPAIDKGHEHQAIAQIAVTQWLAEDAREKTLEHYCRLFMQHQSEKLSTKAAVRLPGALCLEVDQQQQAAIHQHVAEINRLKSRLETLITVESGLPSEARFEFVHTHLPGLITLNAYRSIPLHEMIDTVRFGWANKNIIKNVSAKEIIEQLHRSLKAGRAVAPWTREQWAEKVQEELVRLEQWPQHAKLKIKRPVKVQPVARVWNSEQRKQTQLACPSPLLILCPPHTAIPDIGELPAYDADNIRHRHKPAAQTLYPVIPRLHLFSDTPEHG